MFKLVLFFLLINLSNVTANEVISGSYGRTSNTLNISSIKDGMHLEGDFLGRKYDYSIVNIENSYDIQGTLDGLKLNMSLHPNSEVTELIDDSSKTNVKFSLNSYVNFVNGRYLNQNASLRIEKTDEEHHITGFLLKHLFELYIVKINEGYLFTGYSNGYWTNLQILQDSQNIFRIFGKFQNQDVDLKYSGTQLAISDLIELIILKIHFPHLDLIKLK